MDLYLLYILFKNKSIVAFSFRAPHNLGFEWILYKCSNSDKGEQTSETFSEKYEKSNSIQFNENWIEREIQLKYVLFITFVIISYLNRIQKKNIAHDAMEEMEMETGMRLKMIELMSIIMITVTNQFHTLNNPSKSKASFNWLCMRTLFPQNIYLLIFLRWTRNRI